MSSLNFYFALHLSCIVIYTFCSLLAHCVNGLGCYSLVLHDMYVCLSGCNIAVLWLIT